MILSLKTAAPLCEMALYKNNQQIVAKNWQADRRLAAELLSQLEQFLQENDAKFSDLTGLIVFSGPGSFTGLRIGATVANTLAYALDVPIVGVNAADWQKEGLKRLQAGKNDVSVQLDYGTPPHITKAKK